MHPTKAPGPDGFSAIFFQKYWKIIGDQVVFSCLNFLNNHVFPDGWNHTNIALVPKLSSPVNDFRPISLCNVVYKIISKTLANTLKKVMDHNLHLFLIV